MSRIKKQMDEYRKDFEGFMATRCHVQTGLLGPMDLIKWKAPGHGNLSGTFILHGNRLHAFGDFDDKMYRFNSEVSLQYFANESISHFAEKCTTGDSEWDAEVAEASIREYVAESIEEEPQRKTAEALGQISDMEYTEASYGPGNALAFADEYDFEHESFYEMGTVADHVCIRHLVALKMIAEQLEAQ